MGNHDEVHESELLPDVTILHGNSQTTDSLTIAGVSGIVGSPKRNNRKTENEFLSAVERCSNARTYIRLLHQGPEGPTEAERGLSSLNTYLKRRANLLVMFGNCHWAKPFHAEGGNLFCNVDARIIAFVPAEDL